MSDKQPPLKFKLSRRRVLKSLAAGSAVFSLPALAAKASESSHDYRKTIDYRGKHQAGVITKEQKDATFIAFDVTADTLAELEEVLKILTNRVAYLTQNHQIPINTDDKLPPKELSLIHI